MASGKNVVAIIQARMGSTRLPGKALLPITGKPMLQRVVERVARAETVDAMMVATTDNPIDDAIVAACRNLPCDVFRGSEQDVLDRYKRAAEASGADVVVRITSDCPLIDPSVVDTTVVAYLESTPPVDYASNFLSNRTFPRGLDVEVFSRAALVTAWSRDADPATREHVTPYIYRHPKEFRLVGVRQERDDSAHRWTVDTVEDLAFVRAVYATFEGDQFSSDEVLALLRSRPELASINAAVQQKPVAKR